MVEIETGQGIINMPLNSVDDTLCYIFDRFIEQKKRDIDPDRETIHLYRSSGGADSGLWWSDYKNYAMEKQKYLLDQLEEMITKFEVESKRHKTLYRILRYAVFILTAISAVLAGLTIKFPEYSSDFSVAIVLFSAVIGVITSIEGLRKPAELWIHERSTYYALMDLKREVEFKLNENSASELIDKYFFQMQELLGASSEKWNRNIAGNSKHGATDLAACRT